MAVDLYGEDYLDVVDYARKVVSKGYSRPFYKIHVNHKTKNVLDEGYEISYVDGNNRVSIDEAGIYAIYRKNNEKMECLYVGISFSSMSYRVYRFVKELDGNSRKDESHPAAKKARKNGVRSYDDLYVITLPLYELPKTNMETRFNLERLDEAVAHLLKSKFNKKKIK